MVESACVYFPCIQLLGKCTEQASGFLFLLGRSSWIIRRLLWQGNDFACYSAVWMDFCVESYHYSVYYNSVHVSHWLSFRCAFRAVYDVNADHSSRIYSATCSFNFKCMLRVLFVLIQPRGCCIAINVFVCCKVLWLLL